MIWQIAVSIQVLVYIICTICGVHEGKKNRVLTLKIYSKRLLLEKNITVLFFLGGGSTLQRSWCYFSQRYSGKKLILVFFVKERVSRKKSSF